MLSFIRNIILVYDSLDMLQNVLYTLVSKSLPWVQEVWAEEKEEWRGRERGKRRRWEERGGRGEGGRREGEEEKVGGERGKRRRWEERRRRGEKGGKPEEGRNFSHVFPQVPSPFNPLEGVKPLELTSSSIFHLVLERDIGLCDINSNKIT